MIKGNRTLAKTRGMQAKAADGPAFMNSVNGTPMYVYECTGCIGSADLGLGIWPRK